jgi:exodeoxyribonuclease VII large subunit
MTEAQTNLPEVSVSELSGAIKRTVEDAFGYVRVRGEISGYRGPHTSGHVYFALKDASSKIEAVIWKGVFGRMRIRPEEGLEVIATGKVSTFPGKSSYQLVIESIEPAGVGALLAQREERRRRLAAEGLFDPARKQVLPYLPRVIGVVTSPTGAVIRDIIHRITDRFPVHILVWPVRVQGETSSAEVASAIRGFNALTEGGAVPRPDVLVVARGGGSLEDLWGFNDEAVVRAAADSAIPLVSAVGHETDWTLIDHAADLRAPTPTGAAEMIVPVRAELLATSESLGARLRGGLLRLVERRKTEFRAVTRGLPSADTLLAQPRQRLDRAGEKLPAALKANISQRRLRLLALTTRLEQRSPRVALATQRQRLTGNAERLSSAFARRIERAGTDIRRDREKLHALTVRLTPAFQRGLAERRGRLLACAKLMQSLSYESVLQRGYALVRDGEGTPVRDAKALVAGQALSVQVQSGRFDVVVAGAGAPSAKRSASAPPRQNDLFG